MSDVFFEHAAEMWKKDEEILRSLPEKIDPAQYRAVCEAIRDCRGKTVVMGMGTSGVAARKIAHMLNVANVPAFYCSPGDAAHGGLGAVKPGDLLVILSRGGTTEELVNLLPSLERVKAKTVTVTQKPDSPLGRAADIVLKVDVPESDHRELVATGSIIAVIAIFDAVADELSRGDQFSEETFYYNHTHGAVGAILKEELEKK